MPLFQGYLHWQQGPIALAQAPAVTEGSPFSIRCSVTRDMPAASAVSNLAADRPAPRPRPVPEPRPAVAPADAPRIEDVLREHGPMLARIAGSYEAEPARRDDLHAALGAVRAHMDAIREAYAAARRTVHGA